MELTDFCIDCDKQIDSTRQLEGHDTCSEHAVTNFFEVEMLAMIKGRNLNQEEIELIEFTAMDSIAISKG